MSTAEPSLFSDHSLSQRLERTEAKSNAQFVEARARVFPDRGARWIDVSGTYAMFDGVGSPLTQTFGLGMFSEVTAADLDTIEAFFGDLGSEVYHEVSPLADPSALALLNERGYHPIEFTTNLFRPIRPNLELAGARDGRVEVRIAGEGEEAMWAATSAKGWSHLPEIEDFMREIGAISAAKPSSLQFLGEIDGEPVAAGGLFIHDGVALLAGASTVPEARNRGAQLALLDARLRHAAEQGCDIAMMGAAPGSASQRNAERQGFRIAYTRIKWQLGR